MKKTGLLFFAFAFILLLTACAGSAAGAPDSNPWSKIATGSGMEYQGQTELRATEAARQDLILQATLNAGFLQQQGTATAAAFVVQSTQTAIYNAGLQATEIKIAQDRQATQTAAAYEAQASQTAAAAFAQTQTAFPPVATGTRAALNEIARNDARRAKQAEWETKMIPVKEVFWPVLICIVVLLLVVGLGVGGVFAYRRLMPVLEMRLRAIRRGPHDAPVFALQLADGRIAIYDPDRNYAPGAVVDTHGVSTVGAAPSLAAQLQVTTQDQAVDLARGLPFEERAQKRAAQMAADFVAAAPPAQLEPPVPPAAALPQSASWEALSSWNGAGGLPLGMGASGIILADPDHNPHFMFAGKTDAGKSFYGLRPLIATSLAAGWQVAIFDRSRVDFMQFDRYAHIVHLGKNPEKAIDYLEALYDLILDRQEILVDNQVNSWSRLPGADPHVLAVFDEFSDLADSLPSDAKKELWRYARMVASEGRKSGIHLAIALQNPTYQSIDLPIRRNMAPVAFTVQDQAASRVVLNAPGAEELPQGQFLAGLNTGIVRGVGFGLPDEILPQWLASRSVQQLPAPDWMMDVERRPILPERAGEEIAGVTPEQVRQILEMNRAGAARAAIEQAVFGFSGGSAYRKVKAVLNRATTTEMEPVVGP